MTSDKFPSLGLGRRAWSDAGPDPVEHPELYAGIIGRRFLAWLIDSLVLVFLMGGAFVVLLISKMITFGLLTIPLTFAFLAVPTVYYTAFLGGPRAATPGMRFVRIELRSWDDTRPDYAQALLRTLMHYATVVLLSPLVLIVMLCNERRRAAHDYLSGTIVLNRRLPGDEKDRPGTRRELGTTGDAD